MSYPIIESLEARIAPATLTISGAAQVDEGDSGSKALTYTIALSEAAPAGGVTVHVATEDGTANVDADYVGQNLDIAFAQGETSHTVQVQVKGDTAAESDETFSVRLSNAVGATIGVGTATTVIKADDALLKVDNPTIVEGNSGQPQMVFNVSLANAAAGSTVTVDYATGDKTAHAGSDYDAVSGTLQFLPGETVKQVVVPVHTDTAQESIETFSLNLSNPSNGVISAGQGIGTIRNDDPIINPIPDILASKGQTSAKVDLGNLLDPTPGAGHTFVEFTTNFIDPHTPGVPQKIVLELYDDLAPLTVQNFLSYVTSKSASGDYDGTFFHRLIPGFVLQGGGFDASSPANHITTGPLLHNEFDTAHVGYADSNSDDLRANVRGTIAMAKTGLGPNTASSEFFFNLADNSANLDFQNGGFTVFGKLTDASMQVVDAIGALMTGNLSTLTGNGALTDVPIQNYTSGTPTANNLIQITDAKILAPHDGVSSGYTFSVLGITDAGTGLPSKLVSAKLTGDTLDLKFKPGASGVAKVQVLATPVGGGEPIPEEFLVTIKPNLIANSAGTTLSSIVVPGDTGVAKVKITNTGAALAKGKVDVKFYYSHVDGFDQLGQPAGSDPYGVTVDANDVQIGSLTGKMLSIASGKSTTLSGKVQIPQELVAQQGDQYRIIAVVTTPDGSTVVEQFTDDNVTLDGTLHQEFNAFGTFSVGDILRKNVTTTFKDASGTPVTFKLTGKSGFGQVYPQFVTDSTHPDLTKLASIDVELNGTTAASALTAMTAKGAGHATLHTVIVNQPIGTVSMPGVDLEGSFGALAGLKSLTLGDTVKGATLATAAAGDSTQSQHYIVINQSDSMAKAKPVVRLGAMTDTSLESQLPISLLQAADWSDSDTDTVHDHLVMPALGSLAIKGRLTADVVVSNDVAVKSFTVGGGMESANVWILGSVGKVSLGAMTDSSFSAGNNGLGQQVGTSFIGSFSIKGNATASGVLSNSFVAAPVFGSVYVQSVATDSGTGGFGFLSHAIQSYQRGTFKIARIIVDQSATATAADNVYDQQGHYSVQLV